MGYGRKKIYTEATEITAENVVREVRKAFVIHLENRADIEKLYGYLRGKTAIMDKAKEVRKKSPAHKSRASLIPL